jgi:hypothetical protein
MADMTQEEWLAQDPCPECGARPGRNPSTGAEIKFGHLYECESLAARLARGEVSSV